MWIQKLANKFTDEKSIVLAYGQYEKTSGFVNSFIRFDTYLIALHYYSAASIGKSYMGVGRNIAYKKQVWENCNGFESHKDILSGDDDLFVLEAADDFNVALATDNDSFTYSIPKETIGQYANQKCNLSILFQGITLNCSLSCRVSPPKRRSPFSSDPEILFQYFSPLK
jgi:hypothetical protein